LFDHRIEHLSSSVENNSATVVVPHRQHAVA